MERPEDGAEAERDVGVRGAEGDRATGRRVDTAVVGGRSGPATGAVLRRGGGGRELLTTGAGVARAASDAVRLRRMGAAVGDGAGGRGESLVRAAAPVRALGGGQGTGVG